MNMSVDSFNSRVETHLYTDAYSNQYVFFWTQLDNFYSVQTTILKLWDLSFGWEAYPNSDIKLDISLHTFIIMCLIEMKNILRRPSKKVSAESTQNSAEKKVLLKLLQVESSLYANN